MNNENIYNSIAEKFGKTPAEQVRIKKLLKDLKRAVLQSDAILFELSKFGINKDSKFEYENNSSQA